MDQLPVRGQRDRAVAPVWPVHFEHGDKDARAAGSSVGKNAWAKAMTFLNGTAVPIPTTTSTTTTVAPTTTEVPTTTEASTTTETPTTTEAAQ